MAHGHLKVIGGSDCGGCNLEEKCIHEPKDEPICITKGGEWIVGCKKCGLGFFYKPTGEEKNRIKNNKNILMLS